MGVANLLRDPFGRTPGADGFTSAAANLYIYIHRFAAFEPAAQTQQGAPSLPAA